MFDVYSKAKLRPEICIKLPYNTGGLIAEGVISTFLWSILLYDLYETILRKLQNVCSKDFSS